MRITLKKINKDINVDFKLLTTRLTAARISLKKGKLKILLSELNLKEIRISGLYILQTIQVKYLGLTMNENLNWDLYFSQLKKKLSYGIGLLVKIRYFNPIHLLNEKPLIFIISLKLNIWLPNTWKKSTSRIEEDRKTQRKSNTDNKFPSL